jgi:L-aminopeptidase/D-esterase-like protein
MMLMQPRITPTSIEGIRVGHAQDMDALTGCTVILCEAGAVGGIDQRGGAPGTRETDALHPIHLVDKVHAVVLSGGSAFGLESATGVMRYLEEREVGFPTPAAKVPIVPAAIFYDLGLGQSNRRPDAAMGYQACQNANTNPPAEGNVGAGTGATVGKILGIDQATKSGIGCAGLELGNGALIAAIVAVNAFGDVVDPHTDKIVAGTRSVPGAPQPGEVSPFAGTLEVLKAMAGGVQLGFSRQENTVIGVVVSNAHLNKEQTNKVAQMAHDGIARTIVPAHTMLDGDTIFALSTGEIEVDVNLVGACAAQVFSQAILQAVWQAQPAAGLPSASSLAS